MSGPVDGATSGADQAAAVTEADRAAAVALASLPGMSASRLAELVGAGPAASLASLPERWAGAARDLDPARLLAAHREAGVAVLLAGDAGYPPALAADHQAPAVLFARGEPAAAERPRAAVVGARRCTHYGRAVALRLGAELAAAGVAVVSGLAAGIDGAAPEGALDAGGAPPVGVVGSGLDVVYPRRHRALWEAVATRGLLLSEAPLGTAPHAWRFPARNRILAALADVLVVVEAHHASGTRHTVDAAIARGVTVLAVPGPVTSPASAGANRLLAEGCAPACDVDDVLAALSLSRGRPAGGADLRPPPAPGAAVVLAAVDWTPTAFDTVLLRTGRPPVAVAVALARLAADGWVAGEAGWWSRAAPAGSPGRQRSGR